MVIAKSLSALGNKCEFSMHCWVPPSSSSSMRPPLLLVPSLGWVRGRVLGESAGGFFGSRIRSVCARSRPVFHRKIQAPEAFQEECMVDIKVESRVHLVGTSYGGAVALRLAAEFPELVHKIATAMAELSFLEKRVARVRDLFLRHGMRSQRLLLKDGTTTMHCWVPSSSGPPLLFVHGFGWDGMMTWANQLEVFMEAGFAVFVPDLVFFGQSSTGSSKRSEAFQAECMVDMLRKLNVESRVHVVGTSYGGAVALHLASEFPELVHKVVIASSGICMDAADRVALLEKLKIDDMMRILLPTTTEGVKESLKLLLFNPPRIPESAYKELLEVMHLKNRVPRLELYLEGNFGTDKAHFQPTLSQEVLLVWGENDRLFDTDQGRKLQKHLGVNATLVIIKNAGHTPESESPRAFNDAVLAFLKDESPHQSRL